MSKDSDFKPLLTEIITIGDEILIGQVVDTNSAWIATEFNREGFEIFQITSVSDQKEHIVQALRDAWKRVDIVITTGGLGPTRDDITKTVLAEFFGAKMVMHEPSLRHIEEIFNKRNLPMLDINRQQAMVPDNCEALFNKMGTAPGMYWNFEGKVLASLPGVPYEMKHLISSAVLPRLKEQFSAPFIRHLTILTAGIGESFLSKKIEHIEDSLPPNIKLAYLPNLGTVRLRFSARGRNLGQIESALEEIKTRLLESISEYVVGTEDKPVAAWVGDLLTETKATVATAESCTGGFLAHLITSVPGSSRYYQGSILAYDNRIKQNVLGVKPETLSKYGAVSEPTVTEMAAGARKLLETDYALATSGIAGPDGGTDEKPVGTVWIALAHPDGVYSKKFLFHGGRQQVIERAATSALELLRRKLLNLLPQEANKDTA